MSGWVELGQPYAEFWTLTLREYDLIAGAVVRGKNSEIDAQRSLNQELATLITYAYHDPKNMPDFTRSKAKSKPAETDPKRATAQLRSAFIDLSARPGKG